MIKLYKSLFAVEIWNQCMVIRDSKLKLEGHENHISSKLQSKRILFWSWENSFLSFAVKLQEGR